MFTGDVNRPVIPLAVHCNKFHEFGFVGRSDEWCRGSLTPMYVVWFLASSLVHSLGRTAMLPNCINFSLQFWPIFATKTRRNRHLITYANCRILSSFPQFLFLMISFGRCLSSPLACATLKVPFKFYEFWPVVIFVWYITLANWSRRQLKQKWTQPASITMDAYFTAFSPLYTANHDTWDTSNPFVQYRRLSAGVITHPSTWIASFMADQVYLHHS